MQRWVDSSILVGIQLLYSTVYIHHTCAHLPAASNLRFLVRVFLIRVLTRVSLFLHVCFAAFVHIFECFLFVARGFIFSCFFACEHFSLFAFFLSDFDSLRVWSRFGDFRTYVHVFIYSGVSFVVILHTLNVLLLDILLV